MERTSDKWCPADGDMPEFLREELGYDGDETDPEDEGLLVEEPADLEDDEGLVVDEPADLEDDEGLVVDEPADLEEEEGLVVEEPGDRLELYEQLDADVGANVTLCSDGLSPALEVPGSKLPPPLYTPPSPSFASRIRSLFTYTVPDLSELPDMSPWRLSPRSSRIAESLTSFVAPARATVVGQGVPGGSSLPDDPSSSLAIPATTVIRRCSSASIELEDTTPSKVDVATVRCRWSSDSSELEDPTPYHIPIFGTFQAVLSDDDAGPSEVADPATSVDVDREDRRDEVAARRERERDAREDADWIDEEGMLDDRGVACGGDEGMTVGQGGIARRGRQARGRGRGVARGRGRGRGGVRGPRAYASRAGVIWARRNRLIQHYRTDEDVPADLKEKLELLEHERAARKRATRARNERLDEERDRSRSAHRRNVDDDDDANDDGNDENVRRLFQEFKQFGMDEQSAKFVWKSMDSFGGAREAFLVEKTGPTQHFDDAYKAFCAVWTDAILEDIALETNRYASTIPDTERDFHAQWYPTNMHEILLLFAFWIMLGMIQMPTIDSCFSHHPLLLTNVFRKMFTRKRYWVLNRALHFANPTAGDSDKLKLIRPILDHLNKRFQMLYVPLRNICIDESLTLWKGLLKFKQYIKTKAAKFGLKTYELCDSATGYMCAFFVYTGKEATEDVSLHQSAKHVLKLIHPYLQKGYTLFMDNYFNSPLLARYLKRNRTDVVGTLRRSRNDVPLIMSERVRDGHYIARHADDVVVMTRPVFDCSLLEQSLTAIVPFVQSQLEVDLDAHLS